MTDFTKANNAEAARVNEDSPQRGSVTGNVNTRKYGKEEWVSKGELEDHNPPEDAGHCCSADNPNQEDEPDWEDPDIAAQFDDRHTPR